ncbi:MAG: cellulose biosynthesis protein BcsD [Stagnimonas sp.]|nr:cellulose biosynthesis protein BcsD [Stagnimonas sp.]
MKGVTMLDVEQGSLNYFLSRPADGRWSGILRALSEELTAQMSAAEIRAFFAVLGRRWARTMPLAKGGDLKDFESAANAALASVDWGWVRVRDLGSSVEFKHSCAPLRSAFGADALDWASGLLEGLYEEWLREQGADRTLVLRQMGSAEGAADTVRFRLASVDYFA